METKNNWIKKIITPVTITILNAIIFGIGFSTGKQYNRMTNKIDLQGQRISIDSLRVEVDSMHYEVKLWKMKTKLNCK